MNKTFLIVLIALVLGGGFLYYKNKGLTMTEKSTSGIKSPSQSVTESTSIKEFTMTAKQWEFDPAIITVKKGDKVRIKVKSIDVTHGFALPDFSVNENLEPGKEITVEFIADKKGEFTFFCSVICGTGHSGMKGKLVVE